MKKVSIIIVNWNGIDHLKKCLPSLTKQKYKNIEVIVVDNNSSDNSVEFIKKKYPKTKVVVNEKNLGFAQANNIGYSQASGEYILFLNNDTQVTNNFLTSLVKAMEADKSIGIAQSKILLMDDKNMLDSVGAFLTHSGFLYHYGIAKKDQKRYHKQIKVFSAKGACMLARRDVLEKVLVNNEVFDSDFFAYFEETDLCHRVWLAGLTVQFVPESVIYHKMGGTSTGMNNAFIQFHSFKNRINTYLKNLSLAQLLVFLPVHFIFIQVFAMISLVSLKISTFWAIQRACFWNVLSLKNTLQKRRHVQSQIRNVKDKQYLDFVLKNPRPKYYFYLLIGLDKYRD